MARKVKTPTPRFNLRNHDPVKDKDNPTLIVMVLRYAGQKLVWSTKEKARPRFWDTKRNRVKITVNNPADAYINTQLNDYANKATEIYRRFDGDISTTEFKEELDIITGRKQREAEEAAYLPLLKFIDYYIELRQNAANAKRGTWKVYATAAGHIKQYIKERHGGQLDYKDIDWNFRHDFEQWLYSAPREHATNHAAKIVSTLGLFLREAWERGYHKNDIYKRRGWNIKKERFARQVLSFEELDLINSLDFSDNARLDKVRDLFLIGAFSGLRFSDFTRITPEHIIEEAGAQLLELYPKKGERHNANVVIPLLPILRDKLEKYDYHPPKISSQKFNEYIKEVCKLAGIDKEVIVKRSKGGKQIEERKPKYKMIASHTARRSFATNFFQLGLPAIELMKITGHSTERQFMEYINIDKRANARSMAAKVAKLMGQTPLKKVQ